MKYAKLVWMGSLLGACASHSPPPAASSESVEVATSTPSNDTTPVKTDVMRAAERDRRAEGVQDTSTAPSPITQTTTTTTRDDTARTAGNAAATTPASAPEDRSPSAQAGQPDNSRVNERDRSGNTLTPLDQGGSEADRTVTQHVRQAVMKEGTLSFTAKNVKIITINGKVTLRGPVKSAAESATIEAAARNVAGVTQVENLLEIKK